MNSHDFPAFMRVTIGLGATTTAVPPSAMVGGGPAPIQATPRPLPGPGRWVGTADGSGQPRARFRRDRTGNDPQWSDRDEADRQHALRYEAERGEADRFDSERFDSERSGSGRYRGNRQWSDRDPSDPSAASVDRPGTIPGITARGRAGSAGPLRRRPSPVPVPVPGRVPVGADLDPTPLFTATEHVAIGDSPLYQFVAEFIAIGDGLLDQDQTESHSPVERPVTTGLTEVVRTEVVLTEVVVGSVAPGSNAQENAQEYDPDGGKHRDGWRVAGHRSSVERAPRSAQRSPRHRVA